MKSFLPTTYKLRKLVKKLCEKNLAIAELESIGLSLRIITILEQHNIIYLQDLIQLKKDIPQLAEKSIKAIHAVIKKLPNLKEQPGINRTVPYHIKTSSTKSIMGSIIAHFKFK